MDHEDRGDAQFSSLDFDIMRNAYRTLVGDIQLDEALARRHARDLVRDLTGEIEVDEDLISRIIGARR
jgi:hypothetical protein